jgi:lipopolysaccharide transport system permease protein
VAKPAAPVAVTRIQPADRWPLIDIGELWRTRRILLVLAQRILKVRYQQTALGIVWVVLQPLILVIVVSVFMGLVFARGQRLDLPFPAFLFPAWVAWRTFNKVVSEGGNSISGNGPLVQRIYLPRVFLPLSVTVASVVDLVFLVGALLLLLLVYGIVPGPGVLALPLILAILYAASLGVAFFFSAIMPRYRDMDILTPLIIQTWFWMSPVIYPAVLVPPEYRALYFLNPLAVCIEGLRWAFTQTPAPPLEAWFLGGAVAAIMLVGGYVYFRRREPVVADWLGE